MLTVLSKKDPFAWGLILLMAALLGWGLYRILGVHQGGLRDTPPPPPPIVSRAEWGARPLDLQAPEEFGAFDPQDNPAGVLAYPGDLREALNTIVVHHSAYPGAGPLEIQSLHMERRGFADVAYHFMIAADGTIYEGRDLHIRGAHVQGFNTGSVGVVLLGNFNEEEPGDAQLNSLRALVDYLRYAYDIRYLAGHRDYPGQSPDGTECPGEHLYPLLPSLARDLGMRYGIEGYVAPTGIHPAASPAEAPLESYNSP